MFETLGLMIVVGIGLGVLVMVAVVLKVVLKLLFLPFLLAVWAVKGFVLVVAGLLMAIVLAPVVLGVGLALLVPLLLLGGLAWGALAVFG